MEIDFTFKKQIEENIKIKLDFDIGEEMEKYGKLCVSVNYKDTMRKKILFFKEYKDNQGAFRYNVIEYDYYNEKLYHKFIVYSQQILREIKERIERTDDIIKLDYDEEMNDILKRFRII